MMNNIPKKLIFYTLVYNQNNKFQQASENTDMSKPKPRRVNYRINYCSSEDPEYPVSQLVLQSAESKGWQTKRFAPFPQTLIIELLELTMVTNLSFLSHQNKICTKIQIQGKQDHDQNWTRLGYTTLQSGINTNYQSRQLRNVNLGNRLILLLKFTFHQCYSNHINIFQQIGLIALLVYGQKATVEREMVKDKEGFVVASLSDMDRETIMKLKNLELLKKQAADNHNFEDAKQYKQQIESLQTNLKALIVLEKSKKQAIKRQDYDQAKEIVQRMKKLRGPVVLGPRQSNSGRNESKLYDLTPKKKSFHSSMDNYENDPQIQNKSRDAYRIPSRQSQPRNNSKSFDLNPPKRNNSIVIPFDEIKIQPRDKYPIEQQLNKSQEFEVRRNVFPPRHSKPFINKSIRKIQEDSQEIHSPVSSLPPVKKLQKLTQQQYDQCSRYFPIFNEITFEYLFSKEHLHRQKGISILCDMLSKTDNDNKNESDQFVIASIYIIKKLIDDKILSVLVQIVDYFGMMMKKMKPKALGPTSKNIHYILQRLSDYLGHNNEKFKEECQDVFASLPAHQITNKQLCYDILCGSTKEKFPKVTVGRLNMLTRIMLKFHMDHSADTIIDFAKSYLQDKNSDIRTAAINLMAKISKEVGYQNLFPEISHLKPQVIKMIEEKIEQEGGVIKKIVISQKKPQFKVKALKQPENPQYYCDYCRLFDKRFQDDNFRDKHLYADCPMITLCRQCKQAIQISSLTNHLLSQCEQHKYYKRCPKCKQAIPNKQFNSHTKMKECITAKATAVANRCPLCHEDIQPGQKGWVKHLAHEKCPNNYKS